ncbi:phytanoyl-CoA dioxygenase family protein [Natrinema sp. H-ect4]|uniref:phytanoyl-CoA dioxygenase family protein n=1 Tax=Natrinema sp. H-ect4 TaxID=3242699 RepID=UPI0035A83A8E
MASKQNQSEPTGYELSETEVDQFYEEGYLGPIKACSPEVAQEFADRFQSEILTGEYPRSHTGASPRHDRHLDSSCVYEFITNPKIVDKIRSLYGPNLLLWTSHFWEKESGDEGVPWHQEQHFNAIEPPITATLDLALDPYSEESGCFQVIPGSHKEFIPHTEAGDAESQGIADSGYVDETDAISVELQPGEFLVYNTRLLHRTLKNNTDRNRRTISCRITTPLVDIDTDSPLLYDEHEAVMIAGTDWNGRNETTSPPEKTDGSR